MAPPPAADPGPPSIVLIGKPNCHLCDDARGVVADVCARRGLDWQEASILDDPVLFDEYWERIPVLLIDGWIHAHWRIDRVALEERLTR